MWLLRHPILFLGMVLLSLGAAYALASYWRYLHEPALDTRFDPTRYHDKEKLASELHGLTDSQVEARLGPPTRTKQFKMIDVHGEFRIELLNFYNPKIRGNANVVIKEMVWHQGDFRVAVWFHRVNDQWIGLTSCRWHKDIAF